MDITAIREWRLSFSDSRFVVPALLLESRPLTDVINIFISESQQGIQSLRSRSPLSSNADVQQTVHDVMISLA